MSRKSLLCLVSVVAILSLGVVGFKGVEAAQDANTWITKTLRLFSDSEVSEKEAPVLDAARADCPGQIPCPLTGQLVCRDRCPLTEATAAVPKETPSCCLQPEN